MSTVKYCQQVPVSCFIAQVIKAPVCVDYSQMQVVIGPCIIFMNAIIYNQFISFFFLATLIPVNLPSPPPHLFRILLFSSFLFYSSFFCNPSSFTSSISSLSYSFSLFSTPLTHHSPSHFSSSFLPLLIFHPLIFPLPCTYHSPPSSSSSSFSTPPTHSPSIFSTLLLIILLPFLPSYIPPSHLPPLFIPLILILLSHLPFLPLLPILPLTLPLFNPHMHHSPPSSSSLSLFSLTHPPSHIPAFLPVPRILIFLLLFYSSSSILSSPSFSTPSYIPLPIICLLLHLLPLFLRLLPFSSPFLASSISFTS